eukprot:g2265.t1
MRAQHVWHHTPNEEALPNEVGLWPGGAVSSRHQRFSNFLADEAGSKKDWFKDWQSLEVFFHQRSLKFQNASEPQ